MWRKHDLSYGNWKEEEKLWLKKNDISNKGKGYIHPKYLGHILIKMRDKDFDGVTDEKKTGAVFIGMVNTICFRLLTSQKYTNDHTSNQDKADMFNSGILRVYEQMYRFNPTRASAFSFLTVVITSAFKDNIKDMMESMTQLNNMKRNCVKEPNKNMSNIENNQEAIITEEQSKNIEVADTSPSYADKVRVKEEPTVPYLTDNTSFFDEIKLAFERVTGFETEYYSVRLLTHPNLPTFKRKYKEYTRCLYIKQPHLPDTPKANTSFKKIDPEVVNNTIIIEMVDLDKINECMGQFQKSPKDRVTRVRVNGYQYFGIFSDDWIVNEEKTLVTSMLVKMYNNMMSYNPRKVKQIYSVNLEYIHPDIFEKYHKEFYRIDSYFGLDGKRYKRHFLEPGIEAYQKWLEVDKNNTRVFGFGRLKIIDI